MGGQAFTVGHDTVRTISMKRLDETPLPSLGRRHHQRLREVYRSAGWPCHDALEVDLLAAGLLERVWSADGHESLRVTQAGIACLARVFADHRAARGPHEALVERVAREQARQGRLAWRGLALLSPLPRPDEPEAVQWVSACPDVFSIRQTSVEAYCEPVVHEIKVRRADLLADLRRPAKRAAYLDMAGAVCYVLAEGIGGPDDVPPECGVMLASRDALQVLRPAPRRPLQQLGFEVWLALAKADRFRPEDEPPQLML